MQRANSATPVNENLHCRELTKGQKAMAYAVLLPEVAKLKRKDLKLLEVTSSEKKMLSYARTILKYKPELQAGGCSACPVISNY